MEKIKRAFLIATSLILLSNGVSVSSANASQPKSLPSVASATGTISNGYNFCLGLGMNAREGRPLLPIVNVSCTANTSVVVTKSQKSKGYTIALGSFCLYVATRTDGSDLSAVSCSDGLASDWVALPEGGIGLVSLLGGSDSNFCMDVEVGVPKIQSPIQIYTCQGLKAGRRIPAQRWTYPEALFNQSPYPYPYPEKTSPQPIPVATTPIPVATTPIPVPTTCANGGFCSATDVANTIKLITSVKDKPDSAMSKKQDLNWSTEEPWYGLDNFGCTTESYSFKREKHVDFLLNNNAASLNPAVRGIMFRVRNKEFVRDVSKPNSYLKEVTVQTTREGLCQRFFADANGWMIIPLPYNRGGFAFYGFETSQWPKDSFVEVAQISQRGRGKIVPVMVKNPKKQGPSRAVCNTILALGTVKETLKAATNWVAGSLPNPAAKLIAGEVVSLYFDAIDPPNPLDAPTLKTTAKFALPEKAADFARVLRPYGYTVVQKKDMVMWEKVGQVVLFAELGVGLHSVWRDYKTVCK